MRNDHNITTCALIESHQRSIVVGAHINCHSCHITMGNPRFKQATAPHVSSKYLLPNQPISLLPVAITMNIMLHYYLIMVWEKYTANFCVKQARFSGLTISVFGVTLDIIYKHDFVYLTASREEDIMFRILFTYILRLQFTKHQANLFQVFGSKSRSRLMIWNTTINCIANHIIIKSSVSFTWLRNLFVREHM